MLAVSSGVELLEELLPEEELSEELPPEEELPEEELPEELLPGVELPEELLPEEEPPEAELFPDPPPEVPSEESSAEVFSQGSISSREETLSGREALPCPLPGLAHTGFVAIWLSCPATCLKISASFSRTAACSCRSFSRGLPLKWRRSMPELS